MLASALASRSPREDAMLETRRTSSDNVSRRRAAGCVRSKAAGAWSQLTADAGG